MKLKTSWFWKPYLFFIFLVAVKNIYFLFSTETEYYYYYLFLRALDPFFYGVYATHVMQVILNAVHWLPVFLYVYRIRFLSADFWKGMLILRVLFDVTGRSLTANNLSALYHQKQDIFWTVLVLFILPIIPSYLACYWYAFRQDKIFKP